MDHDTRDRPMTIEATGKRWKGIQLGGMLLVAVSAATCVGAVSADSDGAMAAGMVLAGAGVLLYVAGRIGAWWYHR